MLPYLEEWQYKKPLLLEQPQIVLTAQKSTIWQRNNSSNELTSHFKGSQFCFKLNTLVVVETDVSVDEKTSFLKSLKFYSVNTFGLVCDYILRLFSLPFCMQEKIP